jgi:hypothetical protein
VETPPNSDGRATRRSWPRWPWLIVLAAVLFAGAVRVRLLDMPLERDEGEYAYAGQLLLQGIPPYVLAYNMKLPGTYVAYMVGMAVFGQTPAGIHLTLVVAGSLTIIFIFLLGRELAGIMAGMVAAVSYAVMSISPNVLGLEAHATHFVVLFAVPAIWLLVRAGPTPGRWRMWFVGLLFGLAFVMKQQGLCFALFALTYLAWTAWRNGEVFSRRFTERMLAFGSGLALPFLLTCLLLALAGVFGRFWFWTVSYARVYESMIPLQLGLHDGLLLHLRHTHNISNGWWLLLAVGLPVAAWLRRLRPAAAFAVGFWLFSFVGTAAGLYFREHYFILLLPAFAVLLGLAVTALRDILPKVVKSFPVIVFALILSWVIFYQAGAFFNWPAVTLGEFINQRNPVTEAIYAARQIQDHSDPAARVAVLGSEPEIYFYAHRHSATGYIYTYPLMERQPFALTMQQDMAREIESVGPEFIVSVHYDKSWNAEPDSKPYLGDWSRTYTASNYQKVAIVGYAADGKLVSLWNSSNPPAMGAEYLSIFQRRPTAAEGATPPR